MIFEAFAMVDGVDDGTTPADDRKLTYDEWLPSLAKLNAFGNKYNFVAMKGAKAEDFFDIDKDGGGAVLLTEFCTWVEQAEIFAKTEFGKDLG
jgi:Ca2+-binding EF-hand superfamily protein